MPGLNSWFHGLHLIKKKKMKEEKDDVPLFKNWTQWYIAVILFLVLLIILFSLLTNYYS